MYHRLEAEDTKRSTRIFFPSDAFHYVVHSMRDLSVIKYCAPENQRTIKYYDDLKSEFTTKVVDVTYLRILTQSALKEFRNILGVGVGLGSTQYKPSKTRPLQYCTINSVLTSIECAPILPQTFLRKPLHPCFTDGIELCYYEQNNTLNCHVRFSRLRITAADIAMSRIAAVNVVAENTGAHEGAWFQYQANTFEVRKIDNGFCSCHSVDAVGVVVELP